MKTTTKKKQKKVTGSPTLGLGPSFAVQLFEEDLVKIERLARGCRMSKGAVLRNLVQQALEANAAMAKGALSGGSRAR